MSDIPETAIPSIFGASAFFYPGSISTTCAGTVSGSCCYAPPATATTTTSTSSSSSGTVTIPNAGTITLTDGTTALGALDFTAGTGYGALSSSTDTMLTWAAADTLNVSAAGDPNSVAAFTGSVAAPAVFDGLDPAPSTFPATGISLSSDFVQNWTAGPAGSNVTVSIYALTSAFSLDGSITCTVDDSAGTVTIPAALLGMFSSSDTGSFSISRTASTSATATNAAVTINASVSGPAGSLTFGGSTVVDAGPTVDAGPAIDAGAGGAPNFTKATALINADGVATGTADPSQTFFAAALTTAAIPYSEWYAFNDVNSETDPTVAQYAAGPVTKVIWFSGNLDDGMFNGGSTAGDQTENLVSWFNAGGATLVIFSPGWSYDLGTNSWTGGETDPLLALVGQGDAFDLQDDASSQDLATDTTVTVTGGSNAAFTGQHWTVNQPATGQVVQVNTWNTINPLASGVDTLATVQADDPAGSGVNVAVPVILGATHAGTAGTSTIVWVGVQIEDMSSADQTSLMTAVTTYAGAL